MPEKTTKKTVTVPAASKKSMQVLVKHLVENPSNAERFLKDPAKTIADLKLVIKEADLKVIQDSIRDLGIGGAASETRHIDFPECHHVEVPRSGDIRILVEKTVTDVRAGKIK